MTILFSMFALADQNATSAPAINSGDTSWMPISTALVMLMTPIGLALFYGGMTRSKNVLNTYAMVFMAFAIGIIAWVVARFSIAFGTAEGSLNNFICGFGNVSRYKVGLILKCRLRSTLSKICFCYVPSYFCGYYSCDRFWFCDRKNKIFYLDDFCSSLTIMIYSPIAHMV